MNVEYYFFQASLSCFFTYVAYILGDFLMFSSYYLLYCWLSFLECTDLIWSGLYLLNFVYFPDNNPENLRACDKHVI